MGGWTRRSVLIGGAGVVAGAGLGLLLKPGDEGGAYSDYFEVLNQLLRDHGLARPCIIVDLDAVDHNVDQVVSHLQPPLHYRMVSKSLPSLELVRYVMARAGTRRVMAFHVPFLPMLLAETTAEDILMGKPFLAESVDAFYRDLDPSLHDDATRRLQWLVDTVERLKRMAKVAGAHGQRLRVNLEIDVGLHRGGATDGPELAAMLDVIAAQPDRLQFTGFMGYEAHITHAPALLSTPDREFDKSMDRYRAFYDHGRSTHPDLFEGDLTFNSGGSSTYWRFTGDPPINDVSAGSAIVKPSTFDALEHHRPALFIAAPVLKRLDGPQVPFIDPANGVVRWWNPNWEQAIYTYGGGWAAELVSPPGLRDNFLTAGPPNQNLLPNQSLYNCSSTVALQVGDFVFYRPHQGDALIQFDELLAVRHRRLVDVWKPFPTRL